MTYLALITSNAILQLLCFTLTGQKVDESVSNFTFVIDPSVLRSFDKMGSYECWLWIAGD